MRWIPFLTLLNLLPHFTCALAPPSGLHKRVIELDPMITLGYMRVYKTIMAALGVRSDPSSEEAKIGRAKLNGLLDVMIGTTERLDTEAEFRMALELELMSKAGKQLRKNFVKIRSEARIGSVLQVSLLRERLINHMGINLLKDKLNEDLVLARSDYTKQTTKMKKDVLVLKALSNQLDYGELTLDAYNTIEWTHSIKLAVFKKYLEQLRVLQDNANSDDRLIAQYKRDCWHIMTVDIGLDGKPIQV